MRLEEIGGIEWSSGKNARARRFSLAKNAVWLTLKRLLRKNARLGVPSTRAAISR